MKVWKKVCIGVVVVAVAGGIVVYSVNQANKDVVTVQTAKVGQEHLTTVVTASGQVMPKHIQTFWPRVLGRLRKFSSRKAIK